MIGVAGAPLYLPATETPAPWTALGYGVERMVGVITQSLNGMQHIVTGTIGAENLQGPLGIAQISGETASQGVVSFVVLIGVISTAIGLLNLFPIPILDGGHFVAFADRGDPRPAAQPGGNAGRDVDWSWLDPAPDGICNLQRHHALGELITGRRTAREQRGKTPMGQRLWMRGIPRLIVLVGVPDRGVALDR